MNAAVTIIQATDWTRFSTEDWFRQFGAWMNGDTETKRLVYKTIPTKKLSRVCDHSIKKLQQTLAGVTP